MKIIADTHTHTVASGHAYSTIMEIVNEAAEIGLWGVAITDYTEYVKKWFFNNLKAVPREVNGIHVLRGVEANIIDNRGTLDLPIELAAQNLELDWVIASLHKDMYLGKNTIEDVTNAYLNVAKNPSVNVIGHSGRYNFPYDYDRVLPEFKKNNKIVEVNNCSLEEFFNSKCNCSKIAQKCKEYGVNIVLSTDAHFCKQIGRFDNAIAMLEEVNFPEELILNANVERFTSYLRNHTPYYRTA